MLLFYVDEYGDSSLRTIPGASPPQLKPGTSPYFILAGVGVRDTSRKPLAEKILEIKERHFGPVVGTGAWADTEIKGRHLARAARKVAAGDVLARPAGYLHLTTASQVDELARDLGLVFSTFRPTIFATVVDKNEMLAKGKDFDPIGVAHTYLHQRIAMTMEDVYAGDAAIIVADQQAQHEKVFRAGIMRDARTALTKNLPRKPNYNLVLDKPLWVDTELSTWDREIIQLADVAAYSVGEAINRGSAPTENYFLWPQLLACMATQFRTGDVLGAGISIYPRSSKPPAI